MSMSLFGVSAVGAAAISTEAADTFGTGSIESTIELSDADPREAVGTLINTGLGFLGIIAVAIVLWGGVLWMTAGGNSDNVDQAKKILFSGLIGLIIILMAWGIATFVLEELFQATINA